MIYLFILFKTRAIHDQNDTMSKCGVMKLFLWRSRDQTSFLKFQPHLTLFTSDAYTSNNN